MSGRRRHWSLRRRLLVWLLLPMTLVCAAMLAEAYLSARILADRVVDRLLQASALAIAERVTVAGGRVDVDLPYVALDMLASATHDRVFYKVAGPQGGFVTGYPDLPAIPKDRAPRWDMPLFYDAAYREDVVRVVALARRSAESHFTVQVAHTRGERNLLIREMILETTWRLLVLIAAAGLIFWYGIQRSLAPLALLEDEIRSRSPKDLHPLESDVPREIRHLVAAIDQLIARLGASLVRMQHFISDASHQIRTPLAALRTEVELALEESDPDALRASLARLLGSTRRTSRLADQLLSHARASADSGSVRKTPLDLVALAAAVTREHVPAAIARGIDLGFESPVEALWLPGDNLLLRELLKNLLDNAIGYCPKNARVTVRVLAGSGKSVQIEVEDDGPGIPETERERVLQRFYRLPGSDAAGSGLGLAIVHEIAEAHDGIVVLHSGASGKGLLVRVDLPATEPARTPGASSATA